ncbi:probable calcium-binding protein CML43 [Neltuma alba]|uniref:probable calcium-binding protein CML43 n=1 Tax=Neltuma alba TaxID=207710 RepID=UPI0010A38ECC|nr:probable calcium-binding protein CML43 [Prosopis alba]
MGITEACSRIIGDFLQSFRRSQQGSNPQADHNSSRCCKPQNVLKLDDKMVSALITVFGMQNDGRIKKENARQVVEKLGLLYGSEEEKPSGFELPCHGGLEDEEVPVEEVLNGLEDMSKRSELLHEAFKIFDEDGDGYIDAMELKRVLDCLGLDKGWDMSAIEKMVNVVDLNFDGKVDFGEFELMMG